MEHLIGALIAAAFFVSHYAAYKLGQRSRRPTQRELDEEQMRKAKKMREDFERLMSYDVDKALGRKG